MLSTCLMFKKIKTGGPQSDGTMDKEQTQRFPSLLRASTRKFPWRERRSGSELGGGVLERYLLLFQSLDPRRLTGSPVLALWLFLERLQKPLIGVLSACQRS